MDSVVIVKCRICGEDKPRARPQNRLCRECYNEYMRQWNEKNRERVRENKKTAYYVQRENPVWVESERKRGREFYHNLRHEVMMAYGGYRCACCGETEESFLTLDHINNDGAQHRREIAKNWQSKNGNGKGVSATVFGWIRRNNFPPGFQVLCINCNFSKARNNGVCAHQAKLSLKTA
jgi:hypothetical protein